MTRDCKHGQLARSCEVCESEAEVARLRAEIDRLRAERKTLWKQVPATEGTMMTYAAVHVVRWRPEFGEPACGFIQADREDGDA